MTDEDGESIYTKMDDARDPDDKEYESQYCSACNGSGEGAYDGSTCRTCGGSGEEFVEIDL